MLNLQFQTSAAFSGKITQVAVQTYDYDEHGIQLYDDLSYNLNFVTFDLENLENRAATYSKTLRIPGTQVNNKIFSHLYDIDIDIITSGATTDTFFGKKLQCELLYDSIPIKEGFFELKKASYNESKRQIEYEGEFYSKSKSFAEAVGEKLLYGNENIGEDLNFSEYDHVFDINAFINSHSGTYYNTSTGYYYPVIDYINFEDGNFIDLEAFRPSLYVKEIIDKIFEMAGYTYSSTFFNSELFKSLIIPWTGQVKLDDEELKKRNMLIGLEDIAGETDYTGNGPVIWGNATWDHYYRDFWSDAGAKTEKIRQIPLDKDTPAPYYNSVGEDWDISAHKWTVPAKGNYRITFTSTQNIYGIIWSDGGLGGIAYQGGDKNIEVRLKLIKKDTNGQLQLLDDMVDLKYLQQVNGDTWVAQWTQSVDYVGEFFRDEEVYVAVSIKNYNPWYNTGGQPINVRVWLDVKAGLTSFEVLSEPGFTLYEGEVVEMRKALPGETRQIDFFKNIVNMFNLVVDEVPNTDNKLYIETRDDYYASGTTLDWTGKEDISQPQEIERIETLINKDFKLSYAKDKDDYNTYYEEDNRGLIYGNKKVTNPYLSTGTYEVKVDYSPTPLGQFGTINWAVSKIFKTDDYGKVKEEEFNHRILIRKNINAVNPGPGAGKIGYLQPLWIIHASGFTQFGYNFVFPTPYQYQPYAGHLDNPYNPTTDINFGICNEYFYPGLSAMTSANIYETYWKNYVAELIDLNSKQVTKYIKLDITDIYNLSFSSKIWIDGVLYILSKINDWNPNSVAKIELLKLAKYDLDISTPPFYQTNLSFRIRKVKSKKQNERLINIQRPNPNIDLVVYQGPTGYTSGATSTDTSGITSVTWAKRDNKFSDSAWGIIIGENNIVQTNDGIFIKGDNNIITSGSSNVSIFASNVIIEDGVSDVVVLANNETGKTISQSNYVYLPSGYTIENYYNKEEVDSKVVASGVSLAYLESNYYDISEVNTKTGQTLVDSYSYTNTKTGQTLTESRTYTDTKSGETLTYADATYSTKGGSYSYYHKTTQIYQTLNEYIVGDDYNGTGRTIYLDKDDCTIGKVFLIHDQRGNANVNNISILPDTAVVKTINGTTSVTISNAFGIKFIYSDGSNWFSN